MLCPRYNFIRLRNIWAHVPWNAKPKANHFAARNLRPAEDRAAIFLQMRRQWNGLPRGPAPDQYESLIVRFAMRIVSPICKYVAAEAVQ